MDAGSRGPSPMFLESTPVATPVRGARARLQWLDEYSVPCPQFARRDRRCSHTMPPLSPETVAAPTVCVGASMRNDICRPAPVSTCVPRLQSPGRAPVFHAADVSAAARPTIPVYCRPPSPAFERRIRDEDATPPIRQSLSPRPIPLTPVGPVSLALTRKT